MENTNGVSREGNDRQEVVSDVVERGGQVVVGASEDFDFAGEMQAQATFNEELAQAFVRYAHSPITIEQARERLAEGNDLDFAMVARDRAIREDAEAQEATAK